MNLKQLIYDWNNPEEDLFLPFPFEITDETLRDGLQSPSVRNPEIEEKLEMLHFMEQLGIQAVDIGLPGAGSKRRKLRHGGVNRWGGAIRPFLLWAVRTGGPDDGANARRVR